MGAKGKKGGGGKSKGGTSSIVDGLGTVEMTREQLEQHVNRLRNEIDREREERNFFQLERDKLRTFWEITRQQLQEARAELKNKDRELEENEKYHQSQSRVFKQQMKHLLYEHQVNITNHRAESMVSLKMAQDDFNEQEMALLYDKKHLKEILLEEQKSHEEVVRVMQTEFSEKISQLRKDFEIEREEIVSKYEKRLEKQRSDFNIMQKMEITELNERKNKQVADLIKNHEKAFSDMKIYYNDITLNNLALISSLKEQMKELQRKGERMEKSLKEIKKENRELSEPMTKAKEESAELSRQLVNYNRDKQSLTNSKKALLEVQKDLENLKWENQLLQEKVESLEVEKNELNENLLKTVLEVQQKSSLRSVLLEKKLKSTEDLLEQREAQFSEVLSLCQIDPSTVSSINNKVEVIFDKKNAIIQDLKNEVATLTKARNDLVKLHNAIIIKYNIPKEEFELN